MKVTLKLLFLGLVCWGGILRAQVTEDCWTKVRQAEEDYTIYPYTDCQFDAGKTALVTWGKLAKEQGYKRALYELCRRYAHYQAGQVLCQEAARLGEKAALAQLGIEALNRGELKQASAFFEQVISVYLPSDNPVVSEQIGFYYLKGIGDREKATPYLNAAASSRSALANNMLGVMTFLPLEEETTDTSLEGGVQTAFPFFWRAILLDCPMAEENLGILELVRQQQITPEQGALEMKKRFFSCTQTAQNAGQVDFDTCDCPFEVSQLKRRQDEPFKVLSTVPGVSARVQDKKGNIQTIKKGDLFLSGKIKDILQGAVAYQGIELVLVPVFSESGCEEYCQLHPDHKSVKKRVQGADIRPYRLRFNRKECEDIFYYAPRLVDPELPFVGKTECVKYR